MFSSQYYFDSGQVGEQTLADFPLSERCKACPMFLRFTNSCPIDADYFTVSSELLAAKKLQVEQSVLADFEFLGSILFYFNWIYENSMVLSSVLVYMMIPIHAVLFAVTRRRALIRILIVLVQLKILSLVLRVYFQEERPKGACIYTEQDMYGGPSEAGIQVSGFLMCQLMHFFTFQEKTTIKKAQQHSIWQCLSYVLAYLVYNSKIYLLECSERQMILGLEIGMTYTLFCHLTMSFLGLWPQSIIVEFEETFEEKILLKSLCDKCGVDENLPREQKLEQLYMCLKELLKLKDQIDQKNIETQEKILKLKQQNAGAENSLAKMTQLINQAAGKSIYEFQIDLEQEKLNERTNIDQFDSMSQKDALQLVNAPFEQLKKIKKGEYDLDQELTKLQIEVTKSAMAKSSDSGGCTEVDVSCGIGKPFSVKITKDMSLQERQDKIVELLNESVLRLEQYYNSQAQDVPPPPKPKQTTSTHKSKRTKGNRLRQQKAAQGKSIKLPGQTLKAGSLNKEPPKKKTLQLPILSSSGLKNNREL